MSKFLLNPYDAILDLADKDDRKLYQEACKGLKEKDLFDGKKENYSSFINLIEKVLSTTSLMDALKSHTQWDTGSSIVEDQRTLKINGIIVIFISNQATKEKVEDHVNIVQNDSDFGATNPMYFTKFDKAPKDTN